MPVVAHRGFAGEFPENTLAAVRSAATRADWIEVDVRRCGTGELVLVHDESLDRLTASTGPVAETDWETLRDLDVLESGESIPRLESVFEVAPVDVTLNLELKSAGIAADVAAIAADHSHQVVVSAFDAAELERAGDAGFDALAYLFRERPGASIDRASDIGCRVVHPHWRLCLETDVVRLAQEREMGVNAWTVETREIADALREAGVDGVIADRSGLV